MSSNNQPLKRARVLFFVLSSSNVDWMFGNTPNLAITKLYNELTTGAFAGRRIIKQNLCPDIKTTRLEMSIKPPCVYF